MRQKLEVNLYIRINNKFDNEYLADLLWNPLLHKSIFTLIQRGMKKWAMISFNLEETECLKKDLTSLQCQNCRCCIFLDNKPRVKT